jgi:hypothetical protein
MKRTILAALLAAAALLVAATSASAFTVDGALDPGYGAPLTVQTTQTTNKVQPPGQVDFSVGSELDAGYGFIANGTLYLFLAGNASLWWTLEGVTEWQPLDLFIDSKPGGQNQLLATNPTIDPFYDMKSMTGLTFDSGFSADYWLSVGGNSYGFPKLYAYYAELPATGGGAGAFLGNTTCGGPGIPAGGTNPFGIQVTLDNRNTAGVTQGCGPASGAGVTTGIEWAIPLAAIGDPGGCIKVCAFMSRADHAYVFNQALGPLPPGTCDLGPAGGVSFATIPGDQYFTICPAATPARATSWGRVKTIYR